MGLGGLLAAVSVVVHEFLASVDVTRRHEDEMRTIPDRKQTRRQIRSLGGGGEGGGREEEDEEGNRRGRWGGRNEERRGRERGRGKKGK